MRPLMILIVAEAALLAFGAAALVPAYAATPADDGVTVLTAPATPAAPAQPQQPTLMSVTVGDGDTTTALAGSTIVIQEDPKTGDYHTSVAPGQ
jgi:hypothetical protein